MNIILCRKHIIYKGTKRYQGIHCIKVEFQSDIYAECVV